MTIDKPMNVLQQPKQFSIRLWPGYDDSDKPMIFGLGIHIARSSPVCVVITFGPWIIAIGPHTG